MFFTHDRIARLTHIENDLGANVFEIAEKIKAHSPKIQSIKEILSIFSDFVLSNTEGFDSENKPELTEEDQKINDELNATITEVTSDLENFRFYMAGEKLYHYFWHNFADIIIEQSKAKLSSSDEKIKNSIRWTLLQILKTNIKLLHPFMPFITEEIWSKIPTTDKKMLMIETWPVVEK